MTASKKAIPPLPRRVEASTSQTLAWVVIGIFLITVGLGLVAKQGQILFYLYPVFSLAVGLFLFQDYPILYLSFTWWLWLLSPMVRRIVDLQIGWNAVSYVMLAPHLVTVLTGLTLLQTLDRLHLKSLIPFVLLISGTIYAFLVGTISNNVAAASFDLLNWLSPILFAFHLAVQWRSYPQQRQIIVQTFVWGSVVIGLYGVFQFISPPEWDRQWLINTQLTTQGKGEAFGIRVFSTLNSAGPFSYVIMAGLLVCFQAVGWQKWAAIGVGGSSLLFSLVRSSWGALVVGIGYIALKGRIPFTFGNVIRILALGVLLIGLLNIDQVELILSKRFQTLMNVQEDGSFLARQDLYLNLTMQSLLSVFGKGLGGYGVASKLIETTLPGQIGQVSEVVGFDSGILTMFFQFGWFGSGLYLTGLGRLLWRAYQDSEDHFDSFQVVCKAIVISMLTLSLFSDVLTGVSGMVIFTFLGLSLSAQVYHFRLKSLPIRALPSQPLLLPPPTDPE